MARKAFYFDSSRCVACKTCQVACKKKNDLPIGINYRAVASYEVGEFPTAKMYHMQPLSECRLCGELPDGGHVPGRGRRHRPARR